jgi:hypothetical protein
MFFRHTLKITVASSYLGFIREKARQISLPAPEAGRPKKIFLARSPIIQRLSQFLVGDPANWMEQAALV